jgi:hypothetical protein
MLVLFFQPCLITFIDKRSFGKGKQHEGIIALLNVSTIYFQQNEWLNDF